MSTGRKATSLVFVEPAVELLAAGGEGGDRDAVEIALAIRHLAGLMQAHQTAREHLRVDAVVAAVALRQDRRDHRRDAADTGLQRAAVADEGSRVGRDAALGLGRLGLGQGQRCVVALDEPVDLIDVQAVHVAGRQAARPGEGRRGLGEQNPLRVGAGPMQLLDGVPGVQGQRAVAVPVRRRDRRRHHPRGERLQQWREAAEVGGREADVGARVAQHALDRAEEAGEVVDVGVVEELGADREQCSVDAQLLPVGALAERRQQRPRLSGRQRHAEGVVNADSLGRLLGAHPLRHRPDPTGTAARRGP